MRTTRLRRPGVTLTEVLVAIFTMAIGLLALLTLFPLGAIQMAQALKDDRTGGEAAHGDALLRTHFRSGGTMGFTTAGGADAFDNPQNGLLPAQQIYPPAPAPGFYPTPTDVVPPGQPQPFPPGSPSYPVMLDGLGYFARTAGNHERNWVGQRSPGMTGSPPPRFLTPRRSALGFVSATPTNALIEAFALTDDLTFEKNGMAKTLPVERQGRYNWSAVVQLPRVETRSVMKLTMMVFDGRPSLLANDGDEMILTAQPTVTVGERTLTVIVPPRSEGSAPLIRKGGWIMDSTIRVIPISTTVTDPVNDQMWVRHANFYRIAGVTDQGPVAGGNQFVLDLETPIKPLWDGRSTYRNAPTVPLAYSANITLFAGLAEVFERSDLRQDDANN